MYFVILYKMCATLKHDAKAEGFLFKKSLSMQTRICVMASLNDTPIQQILTFIKKPYAHTPKADYFGPDQ